MTNQEQMLNEIVANVWATMFDVEVTRMDAGTYRDTDFARRISFTGASRGSVTIRCSRASADVFASILLGAPATDDAELLDALGELTNMVAGNIAGVLPQPCQIGLPGDAEPAGGTSDINAAFKAGTASFLVSVDLELTGAEGA